MKFIFNLLLIMLLANIVIAQEFQEVRYIIEAPANLSGLKNHLDKNFVTFYRKVRDKLQMHYNNEIRCILVNNYAEMNAVLEKITMRTSNLPDSVAGVCIKRLSTIILNYSAFRNSPFLDAEKTFKHELAHLFLGQIEIKNKLPKWFEEGLCQWSEQLLYYPGFGEIQLYSDLRATPTFDEIESWMINRNNLNRAYLTSHNAVEFLMRAGNEQKLPLFYEEFIESGDFESSFKNAFNESVSDFEKRWHRNIKPSVAVNLMNFLGANWFVIVFGTLGLILIIGVIFKAKRNKNEIKKMEFDDEIDDDDYRRTHSWMLELERRRREKGLPILGDDDEEDEDDDEV